MAGFLKAVLVAIITVAAILVFMNMAFFFPWYMEIIQTTFEVSQMVSTENYVPYDYHEDTLRELRDKPIFRERAAMTRIEAVHEDGRGAIEQYGRRDVNDYYTLDLNDKPYDQMGKLVTVTVHASYPFRMKLFGKQLEAADIPVSFTMTTVTTRHYKDLEYNFGPDGYYYDDYDDDW